MGRMLAYERLVGERRGGRVVAPGRRPAAGRRRRGALGPVLPLALAGEDRARVVRQLRVPVTGSAER